MEDQFEINPELKYEYILTVCKPNQTPIQELENIFNLKYEARFPTTDQISFQIPYYVMNNGRKQKNKLWNLVDGDFLIHCKRKYHETIIDEKYFIVIKPKESDNDKEIKDILAYSLEHQLNKKTIRGYNLLSRKLYSITNELDSNGFQLGVLNYISTLTSWSIGTVDADLLTKFRAFNVTEKQALPFLIEDVQKAFNCVFIFNTVDKKIHAKKIETLGQDKGFYMSEQNYIKQFGKEIDHDEIVTKLSVYGKDNISINSVSPTGTSFVEDFSYYKNTKYMDQSLIDSLDAYEILLSTKTGEFNGYLDDIDALEVQLTIKNNELSQLTTEMAIIQDNIDVAIQNGDSLTALNTQKSNKQIEIDSKISEVVVIENQISVVYVDIVALRNAVKKENNFTSQQLIDLDFFVREATWSSGSYETAEDLWDEIPNVFVKLNQPPVQIEIDSIDFTQVVQCSRDWSKFLLGDILNIEHSKFEFFIQLRLVGYTHDIDNYSLKLIFSSKDSIDDPNQYMNDLIKGAITAGTTVDMSRFNWDKSEDNSNQIANIINSALDTAKNAVLAGKNQDVIINERGISLTDVTNPNEQMRIINNVLAMTDDNWNTAKLAITPGKIYAEYLFGKIIAGNNLVIENQAGNFLVDGNGVQIQDLDLTITRSDNKSRIIANATDGIKIQSKNGSDWIDKLYADTNGNVVLDGDLIRGSGNNVFKATEQGIHLGHSNFSNAPFRVDLLGQLTASKVNITGGEIQIGTGFGVDINGVLTATGANISGNIIMTGGSISWSEVTAPSYGQITGSKPPSNADNTDSVLLGNGLTKIGSDYIYTGTLSAENIITGNFTAINGISIGQLGSFVNKKITFAQGAGGSANIDYLSGDVGINADGNISLTAWGGTGVVANKFTVIGQTNLSDNSFMAGNKIATQFWVQTNPQPAVFG